MHNAANDTGGGVDFRSQDHRYFACQHITNDPAANSGQHAHTRCDQRPGTGHKCFVYPNTDKHGQSDGVQHWQHPLRQASWLANQQNRQHTGDHCHHQVGWIFHPEYRAMGERHIADRAATDGGYHA